ncbi:alpha-1,2-fucosyltransferase [Geobacillus sp. E263]|uniref:alpha-1,2-fucosyltransferase n=1 Tax=Geobacillus sp. E263 TaxID=391290 RepID=UPI00117A8906|nr:alpha-1,2-fucosyltransferase [Geobacillus sp. E263]
MKIVKVIGGLGNQMFQYAFYRNLKAKFQEVKLDITAFETYKLHNGYELERVFDIKPEYATKKEIYPLTTNRNSKISKIKRRIFGGKETEYIEKDLKFDPEVFKVTGDVYFEGYWQTEKYFKEIEDLIRKDFQFKNPLTNKNLELSNKIKNENSVSIHVRRGDYYTSKKAERKHGNIATIEYYQKAVRKITEFVDNPVFYIFSDDIPWVKENLKLENEVIYVDWNKGLDSYIDMQLMSICKHNIIANSTFSWWGAWLNQNKNKIVIAPSRWINNKRLDTSDVIPKEWIKI